MCYNPSPRAPLSRRLIDEVELRKSPQGLRSVPIGALKPIGRGPTYTPCGGPTSLQENNQDQPALLQGGTQGHKRHCDENTHCSESTCPPADRPGKYEERGGSPDREVGIEARTSRTTWSCAGSSAWKAGDDGAGAAHSYLERCGTVVSRCQRLGAGLGQGREALRTIRTQGNEPPPALLLRDTRTP